jgi:superoxide reductase
MPERSDVYKCTACGSIVAVLKGGEGELKCCEKPMVDVTPDEAKRIIYDWWRPGAP